MSNKIIMTMEEISKYDTIKKVIDLKINATEAAKQLNLTTRQIRNLKKKVKKYGVKGIIHGNRGKTSNRSISQAKKDQIKHILKTKLIKFKPTHACEKLEEIYKTVISSETLRKLMIEWNLWNPKPRRQAKKKHAWRERRENFGEMQQFDGSYHKWFGNIETCLLLAVDDATGKITHAKFDKNEGRIAVFKFWLEYFEKHGRPLSIYLDKFATYKINHKSAEDNNGLITQFERAVNQVQIRLIIANSPQAKGRVERMNGTLQDRLVSELRLAEIDNIDNANRFLEKYILEFNKKFAVVARKQNDLHKEMHPELEEKLPQIFSIQDTRVVLNDYTVRFENKYFQLDQIQNINVYKKDDVIMETHINGEIKIRLKDKYLNYTELPERPEKEINVKLIALTKTKSAFNPPKNHPWRKQFYAINK